MPTGIALSDQPIEIRHQLGRIQWLANHTSRGHHDCASITIKMAGKIVDHIMNGIIALAAGKGIGIAGIGGLYWALKNCMGSPGGGLLSILYTLRNSLKASVIWWSLSSVSDPEKCLHF